MNTIVKDLNPPQQEAVKFSDGPLLILAGAGSGKTRVLVHRTAWLINNQKISSRNLLLLTFTNKAAGEMKERVKKLLTNYPPASPKLGFGGRGQLPNILPWAGTFHSFCARILRADGKYLDIPPSFVIYDENDQQDAIKKIITTLGITTTSIKPSSALNSISGAKNELITPEQYQDSSYGDWQKRVALIYKSYQKFLQENAALDFDDLLFYTVELFEKFPEILSKYQNQYQHILVDEWQDTNRAQYKIIRLLAQKNKNLTVVGDAAQSIYSWRGADHRNIEYLARDFPELSVINLDQNYRSTQKILDAAYHVISKNRTHPILKLWTNNGGGEKLTLYQATSELDEASFVVGEISKLVSGEINRLMDKNNQNNSPFIRPSTHPYSNFAILYRTNAQSRVIEEAMLHAGIPYTLIGGVRFYARREVKDVISYMRLLGNPKDTIAKERVEKLGKGKFKKFTEEFTEMELPRHTTLELLDKILGVTRYLDLYDPKDPEDASRLENIKELRSVAAEFPDIIQFLEQVALVEAAQNEKGISQLTASAKGGPASGRHNSQPRDSVTLMTAHAAKGLEFPIVFIVGLEEGLFPHSRSLEDNEDLEEERRLCYVGMTRAKNKLYLTFSSRRLLFGQRTSSIPSRFLADIPEVLFDGEVQILPKPPWLELSET